MRRRRFEGTPRDLRDGNFHDVDGNHFGARGNLPCRPSATRGGHRDSVGGNMALDRAAFF